MVDGVAPVGIVVDGVADTAVGVTARVVITRVVNAVVGVVRATADTTAATSASGTCKSLADDLHAIQGYKLGILRYIMKEQLEHELPHCMDAVLARYFKHRDVLEMKFVEGKYCVYQDEIVYMESQGHKVNFHLSLGMSVRILTAHTTIDAMQLQLNQNRFVRPHKSFLVNCSYIDKIECGNILLQSGDRITISQSRKKDVDALLTAIL